MYRLKQYSKKYFLSRTTYSYLAYFLDKGANIAKWKMPRLCPVKYLVFLDSIEDETRTHNL